MMEIINDPISSPREKTDAAKALQPYIKEQKLGIDLTFGQGIANLLTTALEQCFQL